MNTRNEEIAQKFLSYANQNDLEAMIRLLSDDFEFISPSGRAYDEEKLFQNLPRTYERIPDHHTEIIRTISQDDSVVVVTNRKGTLVRGYYFCVEARNKSFELPFINIFDFDSGLIKRWETCFNVQLLQESQNKLNHN